MRGTKWITRIVTGGMLAAIVIASLSVLTNPRLIYRWTGSITSFNSSVSQNVPRGASLPQLEEVVGTGVRITDRGMIPFFALIQKDTVRWPDGWKEGDSWVTYSFADGNRLYFQVRDGHLVNYDPAVLAAQPQNELAVRN